MLSNLIPDVRSLFRVINEQHSRLKMENIIEMKIFETLKSTESI
jgi:hypothetical protein